MRPAKEPGLWSRIHGSVSVPTLMGRSNLEAEPVLMHGVAPHMCDESSAALLGGEAGGRSPALPLGIGTRRPCSIRVAQAWPALPLPLAGPFPTMSLELRADAPHVGFERPVGQWLTTRGRTPT